MIRYFLFILLIIGCSFKIKTRTGEVELDRSYKRTVLSKKKLDTKIENYRKSCYKCGMCFSMGKFKYSCLCSGTRHNVGQFSYYEVIYRYKSKENIQTYDTIPITKRELDSVVKKGICR